MRKIFSLVVVLCLTMACLTGCDIEQTESAKDMKNTQAVTNKLVANQPTPTDIDYSLERYNLIKRAYWVNGQREKANSLPCAIVKPLGYITLFTEGGAIVCSLVVDGKVSSLNSYLTPDSEYYEKASGYKSGDYNELSTIAEKYSNKWLADVDGSYGENDNGIFFFTPDGNYIEWTGKYLYSDIPFIVDDPVLKVGE